MASSEEEVTAINNDTKVVVDELQQQKTILPCSRLSSLYSKHHKILQRLDDIESRISSRISAHRRRATNNLDEMPSSRRSHVRLFISHRVQGGNDDDDDDDDDEEEEKKEDDQPASSPPPPPRPHGGKNFSALLHSSAHQKAEEEALKKQTPALRGQPSKKGERKWTLVIEGGLLIKNLDHISAKIVDDRLNSGLPILGCINNNNNDDDGNDNDNMKTKEEAQAKQQKDTSDANLPIRDQWRGQSENEIDIDPIQFTHLFDKVEVELKIIKQNDKASDVLETSAITRSGLGAVPDPPAPDEIAEMKRITWERSKSPQTPDTNAFFIVHNELSEFKSMGGKVFKSIFKTDHIVAKIKLYRRQSNNDDDMGNYTPSPQLCNVFFPTFIGKRAAGDGKGKSDKSSSSKSSKKRKRGGGGGDGNMSRSNSSANFMEVNEASNSSIGSNIPQGKEATFVQRQQSAPVASFEEDNDHKDAHVPNTVTMDEVLHAIFFYIRTRELQDPTDLSIINNDETLTNLFGCTQMLFSAVRGLLLELELLVRVQPCTQPIIFNYNMTLDGAEPLTKKNSRAKKEEEEEDVPSPGRNDTGSSTRRRSTNAAYKSDDEKSDTEEDDPHQTMLSMDIDVEVPNLYHVRTRNLLRRITLQSFEYTSPRIKCIRSLMATGVDEETAKQVLVDVVSGKGYAPYHKQVLMAIGSGAQQGGEAQRVAMIDLRTAALLEKLEEQTSLAHSYWEVANACQGLCGADEK